MPRSTWDLKRYFWAPKLGLRGIFRLTLFRDVAVVSGAGVGGGSLGYANTLYRAPDRFYRDPQWAGIEDWATALAPHFDTAERMLGVVTVTADDPADQLLREFGREIGAEQTYAKTRVGVYFGTPGETVADPFFGGEGPARTGCIACGRCMVGCPHNAKNTLPKNYLWLAERAGATITPERTVVDVRPLGAPDGSDGYAVTTERTGAWLRRDRRVHTTRGVVVAAGPLGTNKLLAHAKLSGALPRISHRLGELVRTNSEAILAVTLPKGARGHDQAGRDLLERLPGPGHAHRDRHLRRGGRQHQRDVHAAGRRRHPAHPPAQADRRAACATRSASPGSPGRAAGRAAR